MARDLLLPGEAILSNAVNVARTENVMNLFPDLFARLRNQRCDQSGQTMTEYVLIIAAIGIAGYLAYQGVAVGITGILAGVAASLERGLGNPNVRIEFVANSSVRTTRGRS